MNDPFDVYIEDLLGMDLEEMHEHGIDRLVDTLASDPQLFAERCGVPLEKVLANSERLRNSSEAERRRIKAVTEWCREHRHDPVDAQQKALNRKLRGHYQYYGRSSLRDHQRTNGELGYFQKMFAAYDRDGEPCMRRGCHGRIKRIAQSGGSTFYCPVCQVS